MSTKLEKLRSLLSDNQWHSLNQITTALEIPENKLKKTISLLTEAGLILQNPSTNQIKLNQKWETLLINQKETQTNPEKTAIGTVIIPPQKTLIIQSTRITNLTDENLELEIRVNKRIREIVINKIK